MKVVVRSIGPLADAIGGRRVEFEIPAGADVRTLLDRLTAGKPRAASFLGSGAKRSAQVFRDRRSLEFGEPLAEGDEIDLVVAIAGG